MNDNTLMQLLIATITTGLTARGIIVGIEQAYQPTQQGIETADAVYIFKLGDNRYGSPNRSDDFDTNTMQMIHTEMEWIETDFQVNALVTQDPSNITQLTAADYLKAVTGVLQSEAGITALKAQGVGIYRIQKGRQPYFKNDRGQYQADPSFDFTVIHPDVVTSVINSTTVVTETVLVIG